MSNNVTYLTSMKVLNYAKQENISIEKALSFFDHGHDYIRRNRDKIALMPFDGRITNDEYTTYIDLYREIITNKNKAGNSKLNPVHSSSYDGANTSIMEKVAEPVAKTTLVDYDKVSRTWEERDSSGYILGYGYHIITKGHKTLKGVLNRQQIEQIYSLYPYNTLEVVSLQFDFFSSDDLLRIARAFGIKKTSKVPKHIIEESPEEKVAEFEIKAKLKHVSRKMEVYKTTILEKQNRILTEENEYYRRAQEWAESVVETYCKREASFTIRKFNYDEVPLIEPKGFNTYTLFSDIHFGKLFPSSKLRFGRGTDKHILRERCYRIAAATVAAAIANDSKEVHMICAGDLFESIIPGGMHQGQVMDMTGEEQVMFALDVFEEMLAIVRAGVCKTVKIFLHGIGGNHDRIQAKREEDRKRTGTLLFYSMLEKITKIRNYHEKCDNITILHDYEDGIISFAVDNEGLSFLGHHGDSPMAKKQAEKQINLHKVGQAKNFTVLFQGHMHSHKCLDEGPNFIYLQLGAITSGDAYVQNQLSEGSQPSFLVGNKAEANGFGFDFRKYTLA